MVRSIFIQIFCLMNLLVFSQLTDRNRVDENGLKQGYWKETIKRDQHSLGYTSQGIYIDSKKEGVWLEIHYYDSLFTAYRNGKKHGIQIRFSENNVRSYVIDEKKIYSNDTIIDIKCFGMETEDGGYTKGPFLTLWYHLNPSKDTLYHYSYEPDSSHKLMSKGFCTNFSQSDYFNDSEDCISLLCPYRNQKKYFEEYYENTRMPVGNSRIIQEITEIDRNKNWECNKKYDSNGKLIFEKITTGPTVINYVNDTTLFCVYYIDGKANEINTFGTKKIPHKVELKSWENGKLTKWEVLEFYKENNIDYKVHMEFDSSGQKRWIKVSTPFVDYDSTFYESGKIYCASSSCTYYRYDDKYKHERVCYYETGKVREKLAVKNKTTSHKFFFEDGSLKFDALLNYENNQNHEIRKRFNNKGQLICLFERHNEKIKWKIYNEIGKKIDSGSKRLPSNNMLDYNIKGCNVDE